MENSFRTSTILVLLTILMQDTRPTSYGPTYNSELDKMDRKYNGY